MTFKPLVLLPVVAFAGLALAFFMGMRNTDDALPSTLIGRAAPAVVVTEMPPSPMPNDADLKAPGVKLVNYWASWCAPCRAEHPMLEQLASEGVPIYGINFKDQTQNAEKFLAEMGNPYAKLGADAGRMAINWGVVAVPETFVIDGNGVVLYRAWGPITEDVLNKTIRPLLKAN